MKVSVVIPTYRRPALLLNCLIKLSKQQFAKQFYEVIVVSDGKDIEIESMVNLLLEQSNVINFYCYALEEKKGPAAARNKGVNLAKGELIVFTDDDCLPDENWVQSFWNTYQSNKKELIAFTGKTIVPHKIAPTDYEKNIAHLEDAEFITANCACTKKAFQLVKGFDEDFSIAWREDSEFQFRLINHAITIIKVDDAVVVHPVRTACWGISIKEQKKSIFNALLYKKHPELYKQKISNKPLWNYYFIILFFTVYIFSVISKNYNIAVSCFIFWMILVLIFTIQRLQGTSKQMSHVTEMFATSMIIPFLSVYYTVYGSIKFKTFLL